MNDYNNTSNTSTSTSTTPGQPTPAPQANTPARPSRNTRDLIDRLLDLFHAPPSPRPRSVSPSSSASSASAHRSATADDTNPPLCAICTRREGKVLFTVCGHRACTSCTKRLWGSMRRLPGRRYDPRPLCFPCPFCRELVARVGDDTAEGERVVEWVLRVPRRAGERERLEAEMVGRTAG